MQPRVSVHRPLFQAWDVSFIWPISVSQLPRQALPLSHLLQRTLWASLNYTNCPPPAPGLSIGFPGHTLAQPVTQIQSIQCSFNPVVFPTNLFFTNFHFMPIPQIFLNSTCARHHASRSMQAVVSSLPILPRGQAQQ